MAVKPLQSVERAFTVLEAVSEHMPIGVAALARLLDEDKSAVQRVLVTLHGCGWIAPTEEEPIRWKLTTRPLVVISQAQSRSGPLQRVRAVMEPLRDEVGETVFMVVPEVDHGVVVSVAESRQLVRIVPPVGMVLPGTSAAGQAIARAKPAEWRVDRDVVAPGASSVASAVFERGTAIASIVIAAPRSRLDARTRDELGRRVAAAASDVSV